MKEFSLRFDALEPRRKKVAIVGFASSSRLKAPFADQAWEVWGMNQLYRFIPRATRWWELHPHEGPHSYLSDEVPGTDYLGWLKACPVPVYMVSQHPAIAQSVTYPLQQLIEEFDLNSIRPDLKSRGYFHSTVDLMLALAIHEGFEEIGVWGVDMIHDSEYGYQKPSASFWIGYAKGRGIKLTLPVESALINNEGYVYGYEPLPRPELVIQLEARRQQMQEERAKMVTNLTALDGMIEENAHWAEIAKQLARGGSLTKDSGQS